MKILIDPRCMFNYASFYIQGLHEFYGKNNVSFAKHEFKEVSYEYYRIMCYEIRDGQKIKRIVIDYQDFNTIVNDAYAWCDIYAKINVSKEDYNSGKYSKLLCIPPGFGIKIYGLWGSCWQALKNTFNIHKNGWNLYGTKSMYIREYLSNWHSRATLNTYLAEQRSFPNYIFFISTLWDNRIQSTPTNQLRAKFIRICKSLKNKHFEGGLFAKPTNPDYEKYSDLVFKQKYKHIDYIKSTQKSAIVFNVPSVLDCHGWKLGEFLAMGKAIISMPLFNHLAFPLIDGTHIRFCQDEEDIEKAILDIIYDEQKREKMEQAAKKYFLDNATPLKVIEQIHCKSLSDYP